MAAVRQSDTFKNTGRQQEVPAMFQVLNVPQQHHLIKETNFFLTQFETLMLNVALNKSF